jgi:hypothetical protein
MDFGFLAISTWDATRSGTLFGNRAVASRSWKFSRQREYCPREEHF